MLLKMFLGIDSILTRNTDDDDKHEAPEDDQNAIRLQCGAVLGEPHATTR